MVFFWFLLDRVITALLVYNGLEILKHQDIVLPCLLIISLGTIVGFLNREQKSFLLKAMIAIAYLVVVTIFGLAFYLGYLNWNNYLHSPLLYLFISLKLVQSFERMESQNLSFSLVLSLIFGMLLYLGSYAVN